MMKDPEKPDTESSKQAGPQTVADWAGQSRQEIGTQISAALNTIRSSIAQVIRYGSMDARHMKEIKDIQTMLDAQQDEAQQIFEQAQHEVFSVFSRFTPHTDEHESPETHEGKKTPAKEDNA